MIRNHGRDDRPASGTSADPSLASEAPIGFVDLPAETDAKASNAVVLLGWALDRKAVRKVSIEREPRPGDKPGDLNPRGMVPVGEAAILNGERPDVSVAYPDYPHLHRAQWSFELRREAISKRDRFRVALHAIAQNDDGLVTDLGRREIHFELADAAPPLSVLRQAVRQYLRGRLWRRLSLSGLQAGTTLRLAGGEQRLLRGHLVWT